MKSNFFEELFRRYPVLEICRSDIWRAFDLLRVAYEGGGKVLICGNGGSASDAGHMSAELLKGFHSKRYLGKEWEGLLSEDVKLSLQGALPAIPICDLVAIHTAYANDCRPEFAFAQLVFGLGNRNDVLFSISTSGDSQNVLLANHVARAKELKIIGLAGISGGKMKETCDVCICVPETETYRVQELHLPVYHALCAMLEAHFFLFDGEKH